MRARVTVIPEDKMIVVDGIAAIVNTVFPDCLHAIQWCDGQGHAEWKDARPNTMIVGADGYAAWVAPLVQVWDDAQEAAASPPPEPTLDEVVSAKLAAIQFEKCRVRDGGFLVDGVLFDSDPAARTSYLELAMRFQVDPAFSTRWKASAGVWVEMNATLFARVQAAGTAHMQAAFAWQATRDAEVAAILAQAAAGTMNQAEAVAALRGVSDRF